MANEPTEPRRRVFRAGPDGCAAIDEAPADDAGADERALAELTFSTHIVSLHATALLYLGEVPEDGGERVPPDKPAAQHIIDTLSMLRVKTRGNLTDEEQRLLDTVLYELRVKFCQCK